MRRETPENQHHCVTCSGTGTRVEVHRSRYELERVLHKYGADEVLFVEADANAAIQFAMDGRYVQLALPLPDPEDSRFTHTPSGKPRTATAQERAYDQALREHWRSLLVAVRGKLQSVESGISTFEQEFDRFLVPHFAEEKKQRNRKAPKAVNWLLGGSHSLAIALVAAFLVPASAVGAFALPTNVVGHLAAPFRSAAVDESSAAGQGGNGLALARGGWSPSSDGSASADEGRLLALRSKLLRDASEELRHEASLSSPPTESLDAPPPEPSLDSASTSQASSGDAPAPPPPPRASAPGGPGRKDSPPPDEPPVTPHADDPDSLPSDAAGDDQPAPPDDDPFVSAPATDDASPPAGDGTSSDVPPDQGANTSPGNGNGNGQGQGNGNGNGNGQGNGQGNGNGQANGQGNGNGQANGQGNGNGQANGQGNDKAKGGQ
jgi:hypothetical protein